MGSVSFTPKILADTLSETVGYKTGIALSIRQMCDHLAGTEFPDVILASEQQVVRLHSVAFDDLFYELLHRVGHTEEKFDGDITGIWQFHKYKGTRSKEYLGVLELFSEMFPALVQETEKAGTKSIDPTPFIYACFERYGKVGLDIAMEKIDAINKGLDLSPHSSFRYTEWENLETLESLFLGSSSVPTHGRFIDQRFIDYLSSNPDKISEIHWRKFEELTAEYFSRAGFQVELGAGRNDDGVDVRIWKTSEDTIHSPHFVVQCKRQKRKIEKVVIKGLYSDVQHESADYGIIVTSSELSPGARSTIAARGYPIEEINKDSLAEWLSELRTPGTGIVRV